MKISIYILAIVAANIITTLVAPTEFLGLLIPAGSWFIGLTFMLRDWVQHYHGRKTTYIVIGAALAISAIISIIMGQGMRIVLASAAAFLISESTDTEIYSRLKMPLAGRVFWSGAAGGILDSVAFAMIAGFPAQAIIGQAAVKLFMQTIGIGLLVSMKKTNRA